VMLLPCHKHHVLLLVEVALVLLMLHASFIEPWYSDAPSALPERIVKNKTACRQTANT
jgi:hypothetical protein